MDQAIELPMTESTQGALHVAAAHLYDSLAEARVDGDEQIPQEVFETVEEFYVATGEEAVSDVRIEYTLE